MEGKWRFRIEVPTSLVTRMQIWVFWKMPTFKPTPRQELECCGKICLTKLIYPKGDENIYRGSITLECWGDQVRPLTPQREAILRLKQVDDGLAEKDV